MKDITALIGWIVVISAWLTGIVNCLLTGSFIGVLVEFFVFPIGAIHGVVLWLL